jgi:quercetin dioxygenase-like cupin family protein
LEDNMKITGIGLALVGALVLAAPSFGGAGGAPIVASPLAVGKMKATTIHATTGSMILESIKIAPGGSFGWHTHGAAVAVVVTAGTLTVYDPSVASCKPFKVSQGQSFVEPANHIHLARNDTKARVTLYAMYLGVSDPAKANFTVASPAGCNA